MQTEAGAPLTSAADNDHIDSASGAHAAVGPSRRRLVPLLMATAALGFGLDLASKEWALRALEPGHPQELLGSVLKLNLTFNPGAAFSLGTNATWLLTALASAIVIGIMVTARRLGSTLWAVCLGLLLGGALGNLTDRFFRAPGPGRGHVVDFLELPNWPIFNVADMCVVAGALLAMLLALRGVGIDGRREGRTADE